MPRYSYGSFPGTIPPPEPCDVIDGEGKAVPYCVLADTDTGEVLRGVTNGAGRPVREGGELVTVSEFRPLPLRLVPAADVPVIVRA